jgi:hypothetical protein
VGFEGAMGAGGGGRNDRLLTADDGGRRGSIVGTWGIDERETGVVAVGPVEMGVAAGGKNLCIIASIASIR